MFVKEITSHDEWQQFINSVKPNTFLHTWQWGEFEKSLGRIIVRLGVYRENTLVAVAFFSKITARRGTFLLCPHGPIVTVSELEKLEEIIAALKTEVLKIAKKEHCDFVRISTLILDTPEHNQVFKKLGFRSSPIHMHSELAWIVDVSKSEEEILQGMKKNTRYSIRKAEKDGIEIIASTELKDFEKFWQVYMSTAKRQQFVPFSKDYVLNEFECFLKEQQAVLFFGKYKEEIIATAFVVYANGSGFYHHGASDNKHQGITASELVQWAAIKEAKHRGCTRYNFWGISPEDAVNHPWYGLSKFKRGFGGYSEAYVHAEDYVITLKYWLNYIVESIRKRKRGL
jgi:peptidoglycan pentaglycine glycine transferase (the first glycine)